MSKKSGQVLSAWQSEHRTQTPHGSCKQVLETHTHTHTQRHKAHTHVLDCMTVTAELAAQTSLTFENAKGNIHSNNNKETPRKRI